MFAVHDVLYALGDESSAGKERVFAFVSMFSNTIETACTPSSSFAVPFNTKLPRIGVSPASG
ncbi:hypothetical protein [Treponema socranskii]|uniref:hypothetical protein n=1 Tax=Treponema socranskii TaxID=53419 RepID=UPI001E2BD886|nr:hypothetical protein [Treponema socranskii]